MKLLVVSSCVVGLLVACSSDKGSTTVNNTTPATLTTSTASPQSTTTIAAPPVTAQVTVATVATTSTAATPATTKPTAAPTTTPATTKITPASTTTASITTVSADGEYTEVTPPNVPSVSAKVLADNSHPDGVYYATVTEGGDPPPPTGSVVFELVQLFRGDDCIAHFGAADENSCVNDYGVETNPTSTLSVPLSSQFISVADAATQKSLKISGMELYDLIHGDDPSAGAPSGYIYVGFAFFLTINGGTVTRLEQWWNP